MTGKDHLGEAAEPGVRAEGGDDVTNLVPAAERTLRIFEAFQRCMQPLTLSKLASEIDAPVSSCHNLVRTLTSRGYLYSLESQRTFYPTRKLWDLANTITSHDPVLERILPHAEALRDASSETVIVGKRQHGEVLYLLVLEGVNTIRYVASPGRTIPLHTSAIGKALLSMLGDSELERWLVTRKLKPVTPSSVVDPLKLLEEIQLGRRNGWQSTAGENVAEVGAISIPFQVGGEALAMAVAGPTPRVSSNRDAIVAGLRAAIDKIGSQSR